MKTKQFKAESKKLLDLMINSIYTNKEIFLRELISNASDAIDKLYYKSLTDENVKLNHKDFEITIKLDKDNRTLTISDNGIGMTDTELEDNLGTIAKSGSQVFKETADKKKGIDIIGQFGVGFYSAFMVSDEVKVCSRAYGSDKAYTWTSTGIDGYSITESSKETHGTDIILRIKENTEDEDYDKYLEEYTIKSLVKKYSDYITYPIKMTTHHEHYNEDEKKNEVHEEVETLNSMIPIWKKNKNSVKDEDYDNFYCEKFSDYEKAMRTIHINAEGLVSYKGLLFIPNHAPYDYYTKEYEKGLQLYSNGVLITDKCKELLPDYYSFVKGVIDTPDLELNISRETLQQTRVLKTIAKNVESKIKKELETMLNEDREKYEQFFNNFGIQLKYGIYNSYGMNKDKLQDLLLFYSSKEKKMVTLKEYVSRLSESDKNIYYITGETVDKIDMMPQVEQFKDKDIEVLYLTSYFDEFVFQVLNEYEGKKFVNVSSDKAVLEDDTKLEEMNKDAKDMFSLMKESLTDIADIRFTSRLKNHPVCLTTEGELSTNMEKTINLMPDTEKVNAKLVLEINENHPIVNKLKELYASDKDELKEYAKVLYAQARLIEGLSIENPTELSNMICNILSK